MTEEKRVLTYLCKFDESGKRTETLLNLDFSEDEVKEKIADGYVEITEEEFQYYIGNKGNGKNGTGYVRGKKGKPVDAPPYVPTAKEIATAKITEAKAYLDETDYVVTKIAEGVATKDDYADVLAKRAEARAEINKQEAFLNEE